MNNADVITIPSMPGLRGGSGTTGLNRRMVSAELLKIRRRRGLMAWVAVLVVGVVSVVFAVMAILHAMDPVKYGPAGGVENLSGAVGVLSLLTSVAAVLVGAALGAGDLQAGVFRDLASTGRSRVALFAAKVPGGLALLWPLVALAWLICCVASVAFAGDLAAPSISLMIAGGAWMLVVTASMYALALGIASGTGSRSAAIGMVLAWQFVVSQLLTQISALGVLRQGIQMAALTRVIPAELLSGPRDPASATMAVGTAIVVLAAWFFVPLAAGAWRTQTRDA